MCWRPAVWRFCTVAGPHIIARLVGSCYVTVVSDAELGPGSFKLK